MGSAVIGDRRVHSYSCYDLLSACGILVGRRGEAIREHHRQTQDDLGHYYCDDRGRNRIEVFIRGYIFMASTLVNNLARSKRVL